MSDWFENGSNIGRWPDTRFVEFAMGKFRGQQARFLEMGCGGGAQLLFLGSEGFIGVGVDSSRTALDTAVRIIGERSLGMMLPPRLYLHDLGMEPLPGMFGDGEEFDCVFDVCTLQHLSEAGAAKAIQWSCSKLKPGGWFFSKWRAPCPYPTPDAEGVPAPRMLSYHEIRPMLMPAGLTDLHWGRESLDLWPVGRTVAHWIITGRKS